MMRFCCFNLFQNRDPISETGWYAIKTSTVFEDRGRISTNEAIIKQWYELKKSKAEIRGGILKPYKHFRTFREAKKYVDNNYWELDKYGNLLTGNSLKMNYY